MNDLFVPRSLFLSSGSGPFYIHKIITRKKEWNFDHVYTYTKSVNLLICYNLFGEAERERCKRRASTRSANVASRLALQKARTGDGTEGEQGGSRPLSNVLTFFSHPLPPRKILRLKGNRPIVQGPDKTCLLTIIKYKGERRDFGF